MIRRGTYVLLITLGRDLDIQVGALGKLSFEKGVYCYVGSAMGGLDQRLRRHLAKEKKLRWHIDYLTTAADEVLALESFPDSIPECDLAGLASECGMVPACKGFGCSDCDCRTHLFSCDADSISRLISRAGLISYNLILFPAEKPL